MSVESVTPAGPVRETTEQSSVYEYTAENDVGVTLDFCAQLSAGHGFAPPIAGGGGVSSLVVVRAPPSCELA